MGIPGVLGALSWSGVSGILFPKPQPFVSGTRFPKHQIVLLAVITALCIFAQPVIVHAITLLGPQINLTAGGCYWPNTCYNAGSDCYLALWVDVTDAYGWHTKARRIDAATGALIGPEFYVSSNPASVVAVTGNATYNSVNNEWFVVYKSDLGGGNQEDVIGQRIASDGTFVGGYIPLIAKAGYQNEQVVAHDPVNNRYLVVWMELVGGLRMVKGRFFSQTGSPASSEFQIRDSSATYNGYNPCVCYNPYYDEFMVVWLDYRNYIGSGQDNDYGDVYGQRINANTMAKIGSNIPVYWGGSPYVKNGQDTPGRIVCNPNDGRYFIGMTTLTAAYGWTARALIINRDGTWYSGLINVTHPVFGTCQGAAFSDFDDTYAIAYQANDGSFSIRRYTAAGAALGGVDQALPPMSSEAGDLAARGTTGEFLQIGYSSSGHALKGQRFAFAADTTAPNPVNPLRAYRQLGTSVLLTWANPYDLDVAGAMIRYRTDTYPTSIIDGSLLCNRAATPGSSDSYAHTVPVGQRRYYTAFAYDGVPNYSPGTNAVSSYVWLNETFDNYGNGSLDNQGGWTKEVAKNSCVLQEATRVGPSGRAVEMFGSATVYDDATVANFGAITTGYHKINFDMRRNANAVNNQAIIAICQGSTIITRVYWGTNFNMLHGTGASFTDLVASPISNQWYHVEIGIDLANRTLDAWVDDIRKVTAKPFYQTATQISAINLTGYSGATTQSYIDNLRGERVIDVSVLGAKLSPDTTSVRLTGDVVTAAFTDYLYVQTPGGLHGIRVDKPSHGRSAGETVDVFGSLSSSGDYERRIIAGSVIAQGTASAPAVVIPGEVVGGADLAYDPVFGAGQKGVTGGFGPNNVGLLVTVFGNVTAVGSGFFYLDDGSGAIDPRINPATGQPYIGVRVLSLASPNVNDYWRATGISTLQADSGNLLPAVLAASTQRLQ